MKYTRKSTSAAILAGSLFAVSSASAEIYTLPDQTFLADGVSGNLGGATKLHYNLEPNGGWSGTPPNAIDGVYYLTMSVSWTEFTKADPTIPTSHIGVFRGSLNFSDDGVSPSFGPQTQAQNGTNTGGWGSLGVTYGTADPDGDGPGTAGLTTDPVNKSSTTSVNFVMKFDTTIANNTAYTWLTDTSQQSTANVFMWIDPNLANSEASQPTSHALNFNVRSFESFTLWYDTNQVDMTFSNIAVYTDGDTPFATITEPGTSFATWIDGFGLDPAEQGFDFDADGDGIPNGVEAWFGTDPSVGGPGLTQVAKSGNTVTFTHPEADPALSDVTGSYEWSLDLATWNASAATVGDTTVTLVPSQNDPDPGTTTTVTATITGTEPSKVFIRAVATQP